MSRLVKICGMREATNLKDVVALKPDLVGFIFYEHSARFVGDAFLIPDEVRIEQRVGVFVNVDFEEAKLLRLRHQLGWIQLHGQESVEYVQAGRAAGWRIIKAFSVDAEFDFTDTEVYSPFCDYFLFDTKGLQPGGNGRTFDWNLLSQYRGTVPFLLSGGLNVGLLPALQLITHPQLVGFDFNSGLELAPGRKSVEQVRIVLNELKEPKS
jgi:phosphoribosylanthranilate isomerase